MDNQRLLVWASFGMLAWLTYQAWQADYALVPALETQPAAQETGGPQGGAGVLPSLPAAAADSTPASQQTPSLDVEREVIRQADSRIVRVRRMYSRLKSTPRARLCSALSFDITLLTRTNRTHWSSF